MKISTGATSQNIGVYFALIPATAILVAWSLGLSALIRKEFDPVIPQWILVIAVAAVILGVLILIGRLLRTKPGQRFGQILVACLLVPVVATAFGGLYLWLAERIARGREPATSTILASGLGVTVFGFGIATSMELGHMISVFAGSLVGLVVLRFVVLRGPMGMFSFGALHFLSLFLAMVVASIEDEHRGRAHLDSASQQNSQAEQFVARQRAISFSITFQPPSQSRPWADI